jgi:hypothetical protein
VSGKGSPEARQRIADLSEAIRRKAQSGASLDFDRQEINSAARRTT